MELKVLLLSVLCLAVSTNGASFDHFQEALNNVANDLNTINKASAEKFRNSVGLTTTPPPTTVPPPPCGGWFQSACPKTTTGADQTTTSNPSSQSCGGWFQQACSEPVATTTAAPAIASKSLVTTPTTPAPCGGWFQSACPTTSTTPTESCGWLRSCVNAQPLSTTPSPGWVSSLVSGLYGTADKAVGSALDLTSKIATFSMNNGVDFFLAQIKLIVKTTNMDVVSLPDIDIPLFRGASLKATGGYFKSVLSISRGGDLVISRDGMSFILDIPVELTDMEIGFKDYSITLLLGMGTSGTLKVGVKENKINIRIRMTPSIRCSINLEKVDFAVLDGLDIHMTYGCSSCGYITDGATSYIANFLKNTIRLQIQDQIDSILQKTLGDGSLICAKFLGS